MTPQTRARLDTTLRAVAPLAGTSGDQGAVRIDFDGATAQQQTDAQSALSAFDFSPAAQTAWEDGLEPDLKAIKDQAQAAFTENATYLAIATPSTAQNAAQIKALTRQNTLAMKALTRLVSRTWR